MTSSLNTAFSKTLSSFEEVHHGVLAAAGSGLGDFIKKQVAMLTVSLGHAAWIRRLWNAQHTALASPIIAA